jgi:hypothetical protein
MTCVHLQQLYKLCQEHDLKLGGSDLIHIVCRQCGAEEVCPATLTDEYDAHHAEQSAHDDEPAAGRGAPAAD